jgi:hypothetical protein
MLTLSPILLAGRHLSISTSQASRQSPRLVDVWKA